MRLWKRTVEDPVCGRALDPRTAPLHEDGHPLCSVACLSLYRRRLAAA